jgi:hypothetical protein
MIYSRVVNLPNNPKEIFDYALSKSFDFWVDEKGTEKHPDVWRRQPSDLSYEEAFKIIQANKPHWVISFRNESYLMKDGLDYWEFGGCNIGSNDYGEVFIWIKVKPEEALKIFEKFDLKVK